MTGSIITLTTDFGLRDPYVAEMKAVILNIKPNAKIIDITHEIEKFSIRMGAYVLASAAPYFPKNTIHVVVVDPGVGTKRKPIIIKTKNAYYIGPDNGVLVLAAKNEGILHVYEISNREVMLPKLSDTFHGRDIFAPAAAYLANGTPLSQFGPEIHHIVVPEFTNVVKQKDKVTGEILHVDGFGNLITNISKRELKLMDVNETVNIRLKGRRLKLKLCKSYASVKPGEPLAIIESHNFLEISVNQGNASERFNVKVGDKITLYRFCSNLEVC
jgi:hypothetical protein